MSKVKTFTLGGKALPIDLHTVWTDDDGHALTMGDGIIQFDFGYRDVRFVGRLEQAERHAHLKLVGDLGPMPFSAESPAARAGLARIIEAGNADLGTALFRVTLGRVLVGCDIDVPVPVTATGLITSVTRFLLPTLPYLELIAMYIRPPLTAAKPGESAVRPEWRRKKVSGWGR
ncbi:MAG: hypothetical protein EPN20_05775 [Magnetospirillum sp.]|nr:MAG: hypothetical protein EPN20_05775 [Magnetospirillum sp.]